jgi:hypothetical protein
MPSTMSVTSLKNVSLQRDYLWEVTLPSIGGENSTEISKLVQSVRFGDYNVEEVNRLYYGAFRKGYIGYMEIPSVTLSILGSVPEKAVRYFRAWRTLMITSNGLYYPKNNYARTMYATLLDRDGSEVSKYVLQGVFPTTFPAYDLSYEHEGIVKHEVTLNVDTLQIQ